MVVFTLSSLAFKGGLRPQIMRLDTIQTLFCPSIWANSLTQALWRGRVDTIIESNLFALGGLPDLNFG